jgi:hypothetical protein
MTDSMITSIISTVGGGIIGIAGTFFGAICLNRINDIRIAKTRLHEAFAPELAALKNPSSNNPPDPSVLLIAAFDKHRTAVAAFQHFIKGYRRRCFNTAWYNYYSYDDTGKGSTEYLIKYSPGWEGKPIQECRELAIKNIEELLKFAKHK